MAKLKLTVASTDEVDESLRPLYVERDGKYELDVDGVPELRQSLKTANREAQSQRTKYKDVDPDEYVSLKNEVEELRTKGNPKEIETVRTQMTQGFEREKKKLTDQIGTLRTNLEQALIDSTAVAAISEAKGSSKLLLPHIKSLVKLAENDGQYVPQVVDTKGNPRMRDDGSPFTVKDLVAELRGSEEYGRAFDATGSSGTGSGAGAGGGGAAGLKRSKMSTEQKSAYIRQHGQEAYLKLPF